MAVRYANYERVEVEKPGSNDTRRVWRRHPMGPVTEVLDLKDPAVADLGIRVRESRAKGGKGKAKAVAPRSATRKTSKVDADAAASGTRAAPKRRASKKNVPEGQGNLGIK